MAAQLASTGCGPHDEAARSPLPDPGDAPAGTRAAGWPVAEAKSRNARFRILSESVVMYLQVRSPVPQALQVLYCQ